MPRLRQVARDAASPLAKKMYKQLFGDRDPVSEPGTATGTPGNWWTVTAAVPDCFDHIVDGFAFYRSPKRVLAPQLRELGQTRAGYVVGSRFVFSQHCKSCRDVGLSEEQIQAIPSWGVASCFSPIERAVLAYTDALVLERGRVPDGVYDALRADLDDAEILELTYSTCTYAMHATMSREMDKLERNMTFLASTGATAPFIGLFGTVWGIMNSFQAIAITKNTSLAVVAPGIAEALFATALGLVAAIPAVIAYNKISKDMDRYAARLDDFANEFSAIVSRQMDTRE